MSTSEIAKSQDEDYLYYLEFAKDYRERLLARNEHRHCKVWLDKIASVTSQGVEGRRIRNQWLCRLVTCIQDGALNKIFLTVPQIGPLPEYPEIVDTSVVTPAWLDDFEQVDNEPQISRDGRTYLATQKLEDGRGAFAYVAITLNDGEPEWLPQAGREKLKNALSHGFKYALGDVSQPDLATVLASRKSIEQRKAVMDYYSSILDNIKGQMEGFIKEGSCDTINDLLIRMVAGLRKSNNYKQFAKYPRRERYFRLLERLARKIRQRILRIERREILLDEVERRLISESLFSDTFVQEKLPWAGAEWWRYISYELSEDKMIKMKYLYPPELVETFRVLMVKEKYSIGERARRRHVDYVAELHEDLERERRAGELLCDGRRMALAEVEAALAVSDPERRVALVPAAANLEKEIAETEVLLERLEEENVRLLKHADELALRIGV